MKKDTSTILSLAVAICMLQQSYIVEAAGNEFLDVPAEVIIKQENTEGVNEIETKEASLGSCDLGISITSEGVGISFTTRATGNANEIGVKNIVLQEKQLWGWKNIEISNRCTYNTNMYTGSVIYLNSVEGKTYKVHCTHYAIINGKEYTLYNESSEIVFN